MVLDGQRKNVDPIISGIARHFIKINPDVLTWLSVGFAFLAGLFFYFSNPGTELFNFYLIFAALFVFLNGLFDALDGKVAKLTNKTSIRGDFLDHALDRYADVLIVGGLALSPWCINNPQIGLLAIIGMLLTSYMGTQSQAVGCKRDYSGLLGRADRLVLLMIFPIIQHFLLIKNLHFIYSLYLMEWILVYFAIIGNITAIQRFFGTLNWFKTKKT